MTIAPSSPYTSSMPERARILLVEDDARLAQMLEQLLAAEGYDTVLARDGQRALHEGLTHEFDALVLDRGLPVMEGLDVLTRLRSRGILTPALVLSALGLILAIGTFTLDRMRAARGIALPGHTGGIATVPTEAV